MVSNMRRKKCVFGFFFSSRRRHTRYIGDWSSDVCSSDLESPSLAPEEKATIERDLLRKCCEIFLVDDKTRSEERRVGKSGGLRGGPSTERTRYATAGLRSEIATRFKWKERLKGIE